MIIFIVIPLLSLKLAVTKFAVAVCKFIFFIRTMIRSQHFVSYLKHEYGVDSTRPGVHGRVLWSWLELPLYCSICANAMALSYLTHT